MKQSLKTLLKEVLFNPDVPRELKEKAFEELLFVDSVILEKTPRMIDFGSFKNSISIELYKTVRYELVDLSNKIGAIKVLRHGTSFGLKECKDAVENVENFRVEF